MAVREARDTTDRRWRGFVDASARLAGDAEPADIFSAILDAVITLLDLEAASIGLVDPSGRGLEGGRGIGGGARRRARRPRALVAEHVVAPAPAGIDGGVRVGRGDGECDRVPGGRVRR